MSKEYIERGALLKALRENSCSWAHYIDAIFVAEKVPVAADVVEVKHGRWIVEYPTGSEFGRCPTCKTLGNLDWHYRPNCGVKMDGDSK